MYFLFKFLRALCVMGFGSGGGGNQTVTQEFKPPEYTKQGWQDYLAAGKSISQTPYKQSGLATVAPINALQDTAGQLATGLALYGSPMGNAANGAFMNAAQGNYANPFTQNVMGIASGQAYNPAGEGYYNLANSGPNPALGGYQQLANSGPNPYTSDAYTNDMIARQANTMAQGFATGTAAQNDASAAMAGAYGGSGHQQKQAADAAALSQQIGNMASSTLAQQQQYKGNMYNADFANQMNALGGYTNAYGQDFGNKLGALSGQAQAYQGDVANQIGANQQAMGAWQSDIGNILQGGMYGLQGNADYRANVAGLQQAGNNQNTYYQRLMDSLNNQWNTQNMYDSTMNEYLGNVLGRASGSYGGQSTTGPGQSNLAGLLGLGATGAGLYSLYNG
jgi:hypothetical protein